MRLRIIFAAVLVMMAGTSTVCFGQGRQGGPDLARFSYSSNWDALPAIVAIERGFFHQEGLVVSGMAISSATVAINSVATGSAHFVLVPQRALLVMAAQKLKFGVVGMGGWGAQMELVVGKSDTKIKNLTDLKGKRVAVGRGSEAFPVLIRLLNQAGMTPTDVQILEVATNQLPAMLQQGGKAEAVFAGRHFTSAMVGRGYARVAMSNADVTKAIGRIGAIPLIVNEKVLEKNKALVQKFVNAWVKSLIYIRQDSDDAADLLTRFFHRQGVSLSKKLAREWVGLINYDRFAWSKADVADAEYNGWGLYAGKILKVQPKLAGYIHNEFAEKAIKTLRESVSAKKK